jgi:hypothetical protein
MLLAVWALVSLTQVNATFMSLITTARVKEGLQKTPVGTADTVGNRRGMIPNCTSNARSGEFTTNSQLYTRERSSTYSPAISFGQAALPSPDRCPVQVR